MKITRIIPMYKDKFLLKNDISTINISFTRSHKKVCMQYTLTFIILNPNSPENYFYVFISVKLTKEKLLFSH